jgi:hypothetical protein
VSEDSSCLRPRGFQCSLGQFIQGREQQTDEKEKLHEKEEKRKEGSEENMKK